MPLARGLPRMRAAAQRAVALDNELSEGHVALGIIALFFDWNWPEAERQLRRAIQLNPSDQHAYHMYANYFLLMRRFDEAIATRTRGVELDPLNARTSILLGHDYLAAGRYREAMHHSRRAVELDPANPLALGLGPSPPYGPGEVFEAQGSYDDAVREYLDVARRRGATAAELTELEAAYRSGGMRAFWRRWLGMEERQAAGTPDLVRIAKIWSRIGDTERAVEWLERAYGARHPALIYLKVAPDLVRLHGDARVRQMLKDMQLLSS
ncbi:MAG: tetratricopeptide repeat protein [Gemmatimonadaceae bacterium]